MTFLGYIRKHAHEQDAATIHEAFDILRNASRLASAKAVFKFAVGDRVRFEGRRGMTIKGEVTKINQTTLTVQTDGTGYMPGVRWRVHANVCTKLKPATAAVKKKKKRAA